MRKFLLTLFSVLVCSMMFAASTVYYVIPATTVGSYAVKVNVNMQGDGDTWQDFVMTNTGKTYNSQAIYSATINELYGGLGAMYFKLYDGDTEKAYEKVFGNYEWTSATTYNGKMWVHGGSSWIAYSEDAESGSGSSENVVTYDFTSGIEGLSSWGNSYSAHSQTFKDGAIVEFEAASKQTSTITDMPVTKGKYVIFKAPANKSIKALTFTCQQWSTKTQTITLHTSTDGGENFSATTTTSSNFILSASNFTNVNAVKFTFSSASNQIGIKSLAIVYAAEEGGDTPDPTPTINHYLVGEGEVMKAWDASQALAMVNDTIEFKNLAAGTYKFKILDRQTWTNAVELTCNDLADGVDAGCDGSNVQFTLSKAADIVIKVVNNEIVIIGIPEVPSGFGIIVNADKVIAGVKNESPIDPSFEEYSIVNQYLAKGDTFKLYNLADEASWVVALDAASTSKIALDGSHYVVNVADTFDLYIKLKMNEDQLYISAHHADPVPAKTYYFTSDVNGWSFEAFEDVEGVLTLTVDTMLATDGFKVTDAEDWTHGNWGAVDGFLTVAKGAEYQLNGIENLHLDYNYENVVLTLEIPAEGNPKVHFVSGDSIIEISSAYYVMGSMNDWTEPYALGEDKTITLPLEADTYEFKVLTAEQDWATALDFNALATVPEGVTAGDNNNIKFTLAEAGDVVISINEEGKIVLEGNFYVPVIGEKVTYYFINNMEWETVYAYAYANEGAEKNAEWPGELMSLTNAACTNGAVYSIEIAEGFETIIFNNGNGGNGNQTANLAIEAGKPYFYNGVAYAALDEACEAVVEDKLYVIGNAAVLGGWNIDNAVEMTDGELTVTLEGGQSYSFKIVATKAWDQPGQLQWGDQADGQDKLHADGTNIAFDMPSTAEVTIKVVDGKVVVEGIPDGEIVIPDTRYIIGSDAQMGNWQIENAVLMENNQITLTLPAGTYTFKIVATKAWNQAGQLDCNNIAEDAEHLDCDGTTDNNVSFVLSEEATVTIKLVDDKIYIEGVPEIPVEKVTYYFINNMEWENVYAYAYANEGAEKNADWPGELMTLTNAACTNGDVYGIELAEGFETIIFNNGNGNQTANLAIEAGKPYYYNEVAYAALDDACESVEPQPVVAYYLAGEMTSWDVADMPAFVDNQVKVILSEVKTYEFKVVQTVDEAQTWLTNENAGTMTRENCTGWSFIALDGEDNNTKLNADVAGEYTFTLDLTDGVKVSVTFPNKEEGSGLEQILMNNGLEKFIYNGHFYIRRENKLYNVQGQLVR